jgi:opacity protein-like surface antigen
MRTLRSALIYTFLFTTSLLYSVLFGCQAKADVLSLKVRAPFINLHSGPASEFPIFHVLTQGEVFTVTKERTGWYKVEDEGGIDGWLVASDLANTELADGTKVIPQSGSFSDYLDRRWEFNVGVGTIDKVTSLSAGVAWVWTKNLAVDATFSQASGNFADNKIWSLRLRQTFFPDWRVSPYLALGTGEIRTKPRSNLVQSGDEVRKTSHYEVGIGAEYYLTSKVVVRAEYRGLLALTERDEQERLDQWLLAVSVFF